MANHNYKTIDGKVDKFTPQDAAAAINYISDTLSSTRSKASRIDDVIVSLANAHENRRARQVTEWEGMHPQNIWPVA